MQKSHYSCLKKAVRIRESLFTSLQFLKNLYFRDSNLDELLNEMSGLTLEQLNVTTDLDSLKSEDPSLLAHFDTFMSEKKMHEVLKMSQCVTELCSSHNVKCLVDVGSGKAYLSQVLAAMQQDSCLLAIDSQSGNSKGAQKRSKNLEVRKLKKR